MPFNTGVENSFRPPPNFTLKPARPGFGPAAEPPGPNTRASASCWLQVACRCPAVYAATIMPLFASPCGYRPRSLA
jgi:hypothetical protein